jgi:hypothetical protein
MDTAERSFRAPLVYMGCDMDSIPETEYMEMLRENASAQLDLSVLKQFVQQLDTQYVKNSSDKCPSATIHAQQIE